MALQFGSFRSFPKGFPLVPPIDLSQLSAQSGGDRRLEREVLALFADDAPIQIERLKSAVPADRRAIAHRLVGAARAIGAGEVARLAAALEADRGNVTALAAAVDDACAFIARHLAGPE